METTTGLINAVTDLLSKSGAALSALGDSIAHLTELGVKGYDGISARRTLDELMRLRRDLEGMTSGLNEVSVRYPIRYFLDSSVNPRENPDYIKADWEWVLANLEIATTRIDKIFEGVKHMKNEFILESTYRNILKVLQGRIILLDQMKKIPIPMSAEEREALLKFKDEYEALIQKTQRASNSLAAYVTKLIEDDGKS
jgi:hypothetical protein